MTIGRLEHVPLREVWVHEATDFTPWLLDNADILADALGIELELNEREHPIGPFSLDLIGTDLTNDAVLIVENQLERTDHDHLGKIITYAAGSDASTIVWISTEVREEHREAIDWLNEHSDVELRFFAIQIGAVRIGDSPAAPVLDVVAKPNEWGKQIRAIAKSASQSGKAELYVRFWSKLLERVHREHPGWSRARKPRSGNWFAMPIPLRNVSLGSVFGLHDQLRHEWYIDAEDPEEVDAIFKALHDQRSAIEEAYGRPLVWEALEGKRASRIADYSTGSIEEEDRWDAIIDWFFDCGERARRAIEVIHV